MKNLMKNLLRVFNGLLGGLLVLIGFTGCEKETPVEYGAPHADYVIKGKVMTVETGEAIPEILVEVRSNFEEWDGDIYYQTDSVFTDHNGKFEWKHGQIETDQEFTLIASVPDVLPEEAPFLPDTIQVSFKGATFTGKDRWYMGKAEIEQNIQMKKNPDSRD